MKPAKRKSKPRDLLAVLEPEQVRALLQAAANAGVTDHALIAVGYHFGLRAAEYGLIHRSHVNLSPQSHAPAGEVYVTALKNSISKTQPLRPELVPGIVAILRAQLESLGEEELLLFPRHGRNRIFRRFIELCAEAGLPRRAAHPHILKSSLASHLLSAGADMKFVQDWLRHKHISSTMRYLHLTREQQERGIEAMKKIGGK